MFLRRIKWMLEGGFIFIKTAVQVMYGVWKISRLQKPMVTIFGGSKQHEEHYLNMAGLLAKKLVDANIAILTGGGSGIMAAATCGQSLAGIEGIGIAVKGLGTQELNHCAQKLITVDYFFARKWLLTAYSHAFVIFPGGFGTLDELMEISTQMQTKLMSHSPIILIGTTYWQPFLEWVDTALQHDLLREKDRRLLVVTDDIDHVIKLVLEQCTPLS
jgi:uncharacterized protein (TIGR00730 family)